MPRAAGELPQQVALETWDYLRASFGDGLDEAGEIESRSGTTQWPEASSN